MALPSQQRRTGGEQGQRGKNWLFIGNEKSGKAMVALLSLVQTCRAMDIKPRDYLEDIFNRIMDHPANQLKDLLPDRWADQRSIQ